MAAVLPPNNGCAPVLRFQKVRTQAMRQLIAQGVLNELEFGLLKGGGKSASKSSVDAKLGWGVEDKGVLLNMEVEDLTATQGEMTIDVTLRSLCYSRGVSADYLETYERFNMKQVILVLGDLGKGAAPWSELVQPAVHFHKKEFNIIWIEVASFASNPQMWLKFGPELVSGLLKFLCIKKVSVIARGIGGAVLLEALVKAPDLFARSHMIYNMDLPKGKGNQLPIIELEATLRKKELQLWFAFKDDEGYDRFKQGPPQIAYDAINKLQNRLSGERARGKRSLNYDEILITENLNAKPTAQHCQDVRLSVYTILSFSPELLESMAFFLEVAPGTHQDGMENGLVGDYRELASGEVEAAGEPLAVRRLRIGHMHGLQDRRARARGNKSRLERVEALADRLQPALPGLQNGNNDGFPLELAKRLEGGSGSGSQVGSRSVSHSLLGSKSPPGPNSRSASNSRVGSQAGSRVGTKDVDSRAGSRVGTKDGGLPALTSSASAPGLQALANAPANEDSDDDDDDGTGLMSILSGKAATGPSNDPTQPWQHYRKMWQQMHQKAPTGYTHPMKEF